ncbi:hypothetical protein SARC_05147 [Sphaeroforma arctica JP610]|uniref:Uncharacterized protein n=1 Tax=Sphaeroforma arctica JP610 TaxID=667725 RepID=A0A0L0G338_9EUKA|nr:hypothetical protein SARC_05147 [Sphaeroforma arctica JP610]KNC82573.1 hypothetical protein SARC_05147 [Sphaeroforma arctica JP610]|eukprot:XP_014156475.1 hypothetical protein SARC_05147 [Sphaeroforma arctica JP610]
MGNQNSQAGTDRSGGHPVSGYQDDGVIEVAQRDDGYYGDAAVQILRDLPPTLKVSPASTPRSKKSGQPVGNPSLVQYTKAVGLKQLSPVAFYRILAILDAERLAETRSIVKTQSVLTGAMRLVDIKAHKSLDLYGVTLRLLDQNRSHTQEIQSVGKLLATVRASALCISAGLNKLNALLPVEDRLEPFEWSLTPVAEESTPNRVSSD